MGNCTNVECRKMEDLVKLVSGIFRDNEYCVWLGMVYRYATTLYYNLIKRRKESRLASSRLDEMMGETEEEIYLEY